MAHIDLVVNVGVAHGLNRVHDSQSAVKKAASPTQAARCFLAVSVAQPQHAGSTFGVFDDRGIFAFLVLGQHRSRRFRVGHDAHVGRDLRICTELFDECTIATAASDELVTAALERTNSDRSHQAIGFDAGTQTDHLLRVVAATIVEALFHLRCKDEFAELRLRLGVFHGISKKMGFHGPLRDSLESRRV